ncbi:hypothetical protein [Mycobacterium sp. 94-17]|uniref:hypothetical protein n=1 Tax=Mycobacterium sp. 94-17 TaxID=2986147 RepID=UPI002D1F2B6C|nr:hypothetical protein [Mycobacterium sp. 94-17]MEB4210059.1 hypothetical protein [Mycobacterium sp. 94-17]
MTRTQRNAAGWGESLHPWIRHVGAGERAVAAVGGGLPGRLGRISGCVPGRRGVATERNPL